MDWRVDMSVIYITTQGASLRKQGGRYVVLHQDGELCSVPQAAVDGVVLFGNVQVSTQAVNELLEQGVAVIYLSRGGVFRGILQPGYPRNVELRLAQYEAGLDEKKAVAIAREIIDAKLKAAEETHDRWARNGWLASSAREKEIRTLRLGLADQVSLDGMRGIEAQAAVLHFDGLAEALPPEVAWNGRNRRPPRDPVNALLSLTYTMLTGEMVSACYAHGLDPFIGFLHQPCYGRPSLALDLVEPLRPRYGDHFVLRLLQSETLQPDDFRHSDEKGCRLNSDRFKVYVEAYQEFLVDARRRRPSARGAIAALAREMAATLRTGEPPAFSSLFAEGGAWNT